jgi:hypothetical protein
MQRNNLYPLLFKLGYFPKLDAWQKRDESDASLFFMGIISSPPQDLVSFSIKLEKTVGKRMKENHSTVCYRKQRKNLY